MRNLKFNSLKKGFFKSIVSILLLVTMITSNFNIVALANENTNLINSKLDYITPNEIFNLIKGKNDDANNIISDLEYYGSDSSMNFYAKVEEDGTIEWKTSGYSTSDYDISLKWKSCSDPEYISVDSSRNFKLKKRPEAANGEEDKKITIQVEATDYATSTSKIIDLNLVIKPSDHIKTPYEYVEENIFDLIKGDNENSKKITTNLLDYNSSAKEGSAFYAKISDTGEFKWSTTSYKSSVKIEWIRSSSPEYIDVKKGSKALKLKKRPEGDEPAKDIELILEVSTLPIIDGGSKNITIPLTILPGEHIQTIFETVKPGVFNAIRGNNTDSNNITEGLLLPQGKNPCYASIADDGTLTWKSASYYPYDVKVEFKSSSNPEIIEVGSNKLNLVNKPTEDTVVNLEVALTEKENTQNTQTYSMPLVVKGTQEVVNPLDVITKNLLFDAIKGNNKSPDNITEDFKLPANGSNPFYLKKIEDDVATWWSSSIGCIAKVNLVNCDNSEIIEVGTDKLILKNRPNKDTIVNLTFEITEIGNKLNTKTIVVPLTVKKLEKINPLDAVESNLFDAIKGSNISKDCIKSDFLLPGDINPFYANSKDNTVNWNQSESESNVKIEFKNSDNTDLIEVDRNKLTLAKRPELDTKVTLTAIICEIGNESNSKEVELVVTVKGLSSTEKVLNEAFNKYLTKENMNYTTISKSGVNFLDDYNSGNVRYRFSLPNVANLAGFKYGEVKTDVQVVGSSSDITKVNNYVWDPIRNDVGKGPKNIILNYTMTKDGESVSKNVVVKVPALTEDEIKDEIKLLNEIKTSIFDGMKSNNFDKDNVVNSLNFVREVHYDEDGKINWINATNEKKYYGFQFTDNESFTVDYPDGDKSLFSATNLVLEQRPEKDTRVKISHSIESIILDKYTRLYPENKLLQEIKKQNVSTDIVVKKIDPTVKTIKLGNEVIEIDSKKDTYTYLTPSTQENIQVEVGLNNKSAKTIVSGNDITNVHNTTVSLDDGYGKIAISVSDEDDKKDGTRVTKNYQVIFISKVALENKIKKLPDQPSNANSSDISIASEAWKQYYMLSQSDKESIVGFDKLNKYENYVEDPLKQSKEQVKQVCNNLFEGIKGENKSTDFVFTDMKQVNFAKIDGNKIEWTEKADGSNVRIDWISSDSPEYINVFNGHDFESSYVQAFKIRKRPDANSSDETITFIAKVTHLTDNQISNEANIKFNLKAYNASLKNLTIKEFPEFELIDGKYNYTIFNNKNMDKVNLNLETLIPNSTVKVNGKTVSQNSDIEVDLNKGEGVIKVVVNDNVKNTLNNKWDEKIYNISIISSVKDLNAKMIELPDADEITSTNYKNYINDVKMLRTAYDTLSTEQKQEITSEALSKLINVETKINILELEQSKNDAKKQLDSIATESSEYEDEQWQQVLKIKSDGVKTIDKCKTIEEVKDALSDIKVAIANVEKKDTGEAAVDVKLKDVTVIPGDIKAVNVDSKQYSVTLPNSEKSILIKAEPTNHKTKVSINNEAVNFVGNWTTTKKISMEANSSIEVPITVNSSDGTVTEIYTLVVKRDESTPPDEQLINVSFKLIGDSKHSNPTNHEFFQTWISESRQKIKNGSTLKYFTDKMLIENNIPFITKGDTYVSSINGLAEFDNGPNSGWMYKVNGIIPNVTYDQLVLKNGDSVEWFYTDDYNKEDGSNNITTVDKNTIIQLETSIKDSMGTATLDEENMEKVVAQVVKGKSTQITFGFDKLDSVKTLKLHIPKTSISEITNKLSTSIKISSPIGSVSLDKKSLQAILEQSDSEIITITISKVENEIILNLLGKEAYILDIEIKSGNKEISDLGGGMAEICVEVPGALSNKEISGVYIDKNNQLTKVNGNIEIKNSKLYYIIKVKEFSTYAIADEIKIDKVVLDQKEEKIIKGVKATKIVSAKAKSSKGKITLTWNKTKGYKVNGYKIYRATSKTGKYTKLTTTQDKTYIDKSKLKHNKTYYYKIRGIRDVNGTKVYTSSKIVSAKAK